MNIELRYLVIPLPVLVSDELTAEEKFMLSAIAMLAEDDNTWKSSYELLKQFFQVSTATLCSRITNLTSKGFLVREYDDNEVNGSPLITLTSKTIELYNPYRLKKPNAGLKKPNAAVEVEKVLPIEKELSKNTSNTLDKEIKEVKIKTENEEKVQVVETMKTPGRLFTTIYSDKKVVNNESDKQSIIAKMFTYAKMEFEQSGISGDIIKQFQIYLSHMLSARKVSGEQVKALVAQLIKFRIDMGYYDDEIIEILQESMLRNWLYLKEIKDLPKYRELKESRRAKSELKKEQNDTAVDSGRNRSF